MREAMFYTKEKGRAVRCNLCRHNCLVAEGKSGICNVRTNDAGTLYSIFYGKPIAMAVDPIEKKPFFHVKPGSKALSIATPGCNFQCSFCQNWDISQYGRGAATKLPRNEIAPEAVVSQAKAHRCDSVSCTYTEPTIFFEYAYDVAKLAAKEGIGCNFVTNGYMTREAIDEIKPFLEAANVDLKAFRKETYRRVMKAQLDGVLDSIRYMKSAGIWVEVTTLVVPGMNDDPAELRDIANFIVGVGREIPWHISRFVPHFGMSDREPTPVETLKSALETGKKAGLRYVYMGNVPGDESENTFCWSCGEKIVEREGFRVLSNRVTNRGECPKCRAKIDGLKMGVAGS
ncbi:MAG TPA: AmmeMemoRadiSam system radical SAM enzyme [bacterium]|nr:AmmeMemoRadiSam system radical SAM enzyme [bacterium]